MSRPLYRFVVWLLVYVTICARPCAYAQPPAAPAAAKARAAHEVDLTYLTPKTFLGAVVHPRHILTAPGLEMLPVEVISAAALANAGLDPVEIEQILFIAEAPTADGGEPNVGFAVRFVKPLDPNAILSKIQPPPEKVQSGGKTYYRSSAHTAPCLAMPDAKTLIGGTEPMILAMLKAEGKSVDNLVARALRKYAATNDLAAAVAIDPVRKLIAEQLAQTPALPPPLEDFKKTPELLSAVLVQANVTGSGPNVLMFRANDEASAKELERMANMAIDMGRQLMLAQMAQQAAQNPDDPVRQAMQQYMERVSNQVIEGLRPKVEKELVVFSGGGQSQPNIAMIGILTALILPAIQAAREAARRNASTNNMKQIILAMHLHHDARKRLPAQASYDDQGKPLLSWRVHLLPYLEENVLYKQFHLNEPWDSEHNQKLIARMPGIYQNPNLPSATETNYLVPVGEGTIFSGKEGMQFKQMSDGTSKTILAVEADRAVIWTKPDDLKYEPKAPTAGLGSFRPGGVIMAAFADGHIQGLSKTMDEKVWQALFTAAGGERVPDF